MRRLWTILAAFVLIAALPVAATAARSTRFTDHAINVFCDGVATSTGGFAYFGATVSDRFGADAFVEAWTSSTPSGVPDVRRDGDRSAVVAWNGTTLSGSVPLLDASGAAVPNATFSARLTPVGEPVAFSDRSREGNRTISFSGTTQPHQPTGTLSLPGGVSVDLATCYGDETTVTVFETNPKASVRSFSSRFVGCSLTNTAGDQGYLFLGFSDGFINANVFANGTDIAAFGEFAPDTGTIDAELVLFDPRTGTPLPGSGHLSATLTSTGESFTEVLRSATGRRITRGEVIDVEGTLTIAAHTFDLGACVGQDSRTKDIQTAPSGPKPGGKAPRNDLPGGATLLRAGGSASGSTRGATPVAEAPFECLMFTDPETGEVYVTEVGHTVWYRFVGTGSPMTIDTAGSDYDTVAAIYTSAGGTYAPVESGCVDDVPTPPIGRTLQASVTIPTVAGTTYYVQIGGFPDSQTYGNLRVRLR